MLRKLNTYKVSIVAILLMTIPSVYVCQILCDLDIYSMKRVCHASVCDSKSNSDLAHDVLSESHDHHSMSEGHSHDSHTESKSQSDHDSQKEDDCCEDMTSSVFESLIIQKVNLPSLEAKLFFIFEIEVPIYSVSFSYILTEPFKFYSDSSPPTKGADIFILVQSFLL